MGATTMGGAKGGRRWAVRLVLALAIVAIVFGGVAVGVQAYSLSDFTWGAGAHR
jgi:hypothetical protein